MCDDIFGFDMDFDGDTDEGDLFLASQLFDDETDEDENEDSFDSFAGEDEDEYY